MLVGRDQAARAKMELLRGLRGDPDEGRVARPGRTVADLLDAAAELRMERRRQAEAQPGKGTWTNWPRTRRPPGPRPGS